MPAAPCKECGRRPKLAGRHRCVTCQLRHAPIDDQVAESRRRLAMVPEALRVRRSKTIEAQAPAGTSFCAGCQSFRDVEDFGKATQCRACVSATSHAAMVEKVYGITAAQYADLLALQGGRCAICRGAPKSKRLAVDHSHTTGAVRGLLCSKCNNEALGALHDSVELAWNAYTYLKSPPNATATQWEKYLDESREATRPAAASAPSFAQPSEADRKPAQAAAQPVLDDRAPGDLVLSGGSWDENGRYKLYQRRDDDRPSF